MNHLLPESLFPASQTQFLSSWSLNCWLRLDAKRGRLTKFWSRDVWPFGLWISKLTQYKLLSITNEPLFILWLRPFSWRVKLGRGVVSWTVVEKTWRTVCKPIGQLLKTEASSVWRDKGAQKGEKKRVGARFKILFWRARSKRILFFGPCRLESACGRPISQWWPDSVWSRVGVLHNNSSNSGREDKSEERRKAPVQRTFGRLVCPLQHLCRPIRLFFSNNYALLSARFWVWVPSLQFLSTRIWT